MGSIYQPRARATGLDEGCVHHCVQLHPLGLQLLHPPPQNLSCAPISKERIHARDTVLMASVDLLFSASACSSDICHLSALQSDRRMLNMVNSEQSVMQGGQGQMLMVTMPSMINPK